MADKGFFHNSLLSKLSNRSICKGTMSSICTADKATDYNETFTVFELSNALLNTNGVSNGCYCERNFDFKLKNVNVFVHFKNTL
jgi:hypothetical protein